MVAQIPSDTHAINDTGHTTDHNNATDVLVLITGTAAGGTPTVQGTMNNLAGGVTAQRFLRGNGTNVVLDKIYRSDIQNCQAASAGFTPASPASTTSTSMVMMGLAMAYTPTQSGIVVVHVTGTGATATSSVGFNVGVRYGTGTAPAHGAAVTGTTAGQDITDHGSGAGSQVGFAFVARLSGLTANTAYWFDLALSTTNASDAASLASIMAVIEEKLA